MKLEVVKSCGATHSVSRQSPARTWDNQKIIFRSAVHINNEGTNVNWNPNLLSLKSHYPNITLGSLPLTKEPADPGYNIGSLLQPDSA